MDLSQLRNSAELLDKVTVIALVVGLLAILAAGATTWMSIKYRTEAGQQNSAEDRHRLKAVDHAAKLETELTAMRERNTQLEKSITEANDKTTEAKSQITELERALESAKAQRPKVEPVTPEVASHQDVSTAIPIEAPSTVSDAPDRQLIAGISRFAGTKAAIYAIDDVPDASQVASRINAMLMEAGWASATWKWAGVSGIVGVVVLTKDGNDPAVDQAAAATVEVLRSGGFNVARASWPPDADWRKFRGNLSGPQTPDPTEAGIRIVIGARASSASK
jgi:hypothetical protein